jgi:hypothetical protein
VDVVEGRLREVQRDVTVAVRREDGHVVLELGVAAEAVDHVGLRGDVEDEVDLACFELLEGRVEVE